MNKKKFKNVLVVLGGSSGERKVSLESGKACVKALKKKGYSVSTFDPKNKNSIMTDALITINRLAFVNDKSTPEILISGPIL